MISEIVPQLASSNLETNLSFYTEHLGAEVLYSHRDEDQLLWAMIKLGSSKLGFNQIQGDDQPTPADMKAVEVSLYCDDLEALRKKLDDIEMSPSAIEPVFGMDRFFVKDHDDYTLVFWNNSVFQG